MSEQIYWVILRQSSRVEHAMTSLRGAYTLCSKRNNCRLRIAGGTRCAECVALVAARREAGK